MSAIAQARRIASWLLDEVAVTSRAAEMRAGDAAGRVRQFSERLAEVAVHGRDAVTVVNGESGRLLFALNDAAEADSVRLVREVGGRLDALFDGELREAAAAEIERRGRERLAAFTVAAAEAWRQRRREAIEQGLAAVDARLAADLKAELDVLRESAAELLGLELTVPEPEGRLAESRRFFYNTAEDVGQTELLAGAVRRWLPGEFGRRTASEHLRREAPGLVDSQVGRARGDLQYRLAEATRALERVVGQRYADGTDRIRSALQAAAELGEASAAEAGREGKRIGRTGSGAASRHVLAGPGRRAEVDPSPDRKRWKLMMSSSQDDSGSPFSAAGASASVRPPLEASETRFQSVLFEQPARSAGVDGLQEPVVLESVTRFAETMRRMREHLAEAEQLHYPLQKQAWFTTRSRSRPGSWTPSRSTARRSARSQKSSAGSM